MVQSSANKRIAHLRMMAGASCVALALAASPMAAYAQSAVASFDIRPAPLSQSLLEFGRQAGISISADRALTNGVQSRPVSGSMPVERALEQLLDGTGLKAQFYGPNTVRLVRSGQGDDTGNDLQAQDNQEITAVSDIIVTAQKREQSIQDVPIAVTALSADALDVMKIEGGSELLRAIPNVSFSKANFSMYNFSIRGIGTKAISAASDPAVAVSFNNSPLIRNRLFEQEYLDVNRVEVLRGPQGTLYGRNATAGVVNMIPNLPQPDFDALLKVEAGNYGSMRGQMMINIPLTDTFWVRGGASVTKRDGFDHNTEKDTWVNGRDLFSTRLSAAWEPSDRFHANMIWEHFEEDDNRARTGKQLCTPDPGPTSVGSFQLTTAEAKGRLSQGCLPGSLYSENAYGTPNGTGMAQMFAAAGIVYGYKRVGNTRVIVNAVDPNVNPYENVIQSRDLREIATSYDPKFRAKNDIIQLNMEFELSDNLKLFSQTAYTKDSYWSTQDYMRYISNDIFNDSDNLVNTRNVAIPNSLVAPGGIFTDPQLGPSSRMEAADLSSSENNQFYQEFRIQSSYQGAFNFSLGANYLDFETEDNYYVFNNVFTLIAQYRYNTGGALNSTVKTNDCTDGSIKECVYVDLSPISNLAGDGHNYFRSKNVVSTNSWGVFGEAYLNLPENMHLTAGLRYTNDKKTATPYPSQLLLGSWDTMGFGPVTGGKSVRGYSPLPDIKQSWGAVTGRLVLDWKPSDTVMGYVSYARGYKGGGVNPPRADIDQTVVQYHPQVETFDPEYLDAF
nr:TonB-dependent receptor [Brevundimonas sp.]